MKSSEHFLLIIFVLSLTLSSCKKDEEAKSNKEILTSKAWKWSSVKFNTTNLPIPDCISDNIITFATNDTYSETTGTIKCDPDETTGTGTWSISADEKEFIFNGESFSFEITENKLVLTMTQGIGTTILTFISLQ